MTDFNAMSDDQLDEWLAVNVMGWMLDLVENEWGLRYYRDADGKSVMDARLWQPTHDLNQAVECAEKWKKVAEGRNIEIVYTWSGYHIQLRVVNKVVGESKVDEFARALCEATAMAMEGEGR